MKRVHSHPALILSPGTQVVSLVEIRGDGGGTLHPAGTVGVVVKSPRDGQHSYRVRFVGNIEVPLKADELVMLAKFKEGQALDELAGPRDDLYRYVIYRCVTGSRAYGLDDADSDIDYRGIYLPPADQHWSLYGVPEQLECERTQETYWELQKFLVLALKANPSILECLYTPLVEKTTPWAEELRAMRSGFVSRLVYQTYNGYVTSQFKKLEATLRNQNRIKWKHAMHLLRLLLAGIQVLRTGELAVRVDEHRDALLSVKHGEWTWEQVDHWRQELQQMFEEAYRTTRLPERPDYSRANALLLSARRAATQEGYAP